MDRINKLYSDYRTKKGLKRYNKCVKRVLEQNTGIDPRACEEYLYKSSFGKRRSRSRRHHRKSKPRSRRHRRKSKSKSRSKSRRHRRRSRRFGYSHDMGPQVYNAHMQDGILLADNAFTDLGNPLVRALNAGSG